MEEEIWKDVVGYEGRYMVSNFGQVRSLFRYTDVVNKFGTVYKLNYPERILKPSGGSDWYKSCALCKNGSIKTALVHRLVAEAFIPNPNNYPEVNHIDGDKSNPHYSNLEWCTRKQNAQHMYDANLFEVKRGSVRGHSILTEQDVIKMREIYAEGNIGYRTIAKMFGCCMSTVRQIVLRERNSWSHV